MEPRELQGTDGVLLELVSRTFATRRGPVTALDGMSLRAEPGQIVAVVGPSGCGKTHAARADLRAAAARRGNGPLRAGRADAPARSAAAVVRRARQRRAGAARARHDARRRPRAGGAVARALRPRRVRARAPGRRCRAACASACRSCARCWPASRCWRSTSRSRARRDHAGRDAGLAGPRAGHRAADGRAGHPRRRGGGRARRPGGRDVTPARAGGGRDRGRRCPARAGAPTRRWWRCASGRSTRWGWAR